MLDVADMHCTMLDLCYLTLVIVLFRRDLECCQRVLAECKQGLKASESEQGVQVSNAEWAFEQNNSAPGFDAVVGDCSLIVNMVVQAVV